MPEAGPRGPVTPGGRWRASGWQAAMAVMATLTAFLAITQIRTVRQIKQTLPIPPAQVEELVYVLRAQERHRAALEEQVAELRVLQASYEKAATERRLALAQMNRELQDLRALGGLTPLEGPGIVVTLSDSTQPSKPGEDPNKTILHYSDIAAVVSELWAAGAEAVTVNGERVVSSTGINCVGTTILCNTKRIAPPYVLTAIGDPQGLQSYLRRPGGALDLLVAFDFPVSVKTYSRVETPPYRGVFQFEYAEVSSKE